MTGQRDMLHMQKEALRDELLDTRRERDGYLSDRATVMTVLSSVRAMREKLLAAHRNTESSLTKDAEALRLCIEGAIADIGELHTEVARKKGISNHNEKAADEFRDRMTVRVQEIVSTVSDFKVDQQSRHSAIAADFLQLRDQDQTDCRSNCADLGTLANKAEDLLANLTTHCKATESSLVSQLTERDVSVEQYREAVASTMDKFKTAIAKQLERLRAEASELDARMKDWAEKTTQRIADRETSVTTFSNQMTKSLTDLQAAVVAAATSHITHLYVSRVCVTAVAARRLRAHCVALVS